MTANLVSYWRQREDMRHNRQQEQLAKMSHDEAVRHNFQMEKNAANQIALGYAQLSEQNRHNLATEEVAVSNQFELNRHNTATEVFDSSKLQETQRHNEQMETLESREVFTKQRRQDLDEQKFELAKTEFQVGTFLDLGNFFTRSASTIAGLFGGKKK